MHLGILHERMEHETDYETAIHYFLEEFAGDIAFVKGSEEESSPQLAAVVAKVVHDTLGVRLTTANPPRTLCLKKHHFYHGNAMVGQHVVIFLYLEKSDVGVMAMMPGKSAGMDVARFRLGSPLIKPANN